MSEDHLSYDPSTKKKVLTALLDHLYEPSFKSLNKRLHDIIYKNSSIKQNAQQAFTYKGNYYQIDEMKPLPRPLNQLDKSLYPEMQKYLVELDSIQVYEHPYVNNYLTQILNTSDNFPDYYRLLPESLHSVLDTLREQCPCRRRSLSDKRITEIQRKNVLPVELMKKRMVHNLLLA